ncbi:MAG: tetratricopeptide repeat protein [Candidatus Solibacter usitatus]|nr:tetratricopeptide repeat protein [Candidatus Solibacter usitatus]
MARVSLTLLFAGLLACAQQAKPSKPEAQPPRPPAHAEPEEEDAVSTPKEYTLNPIQAQSEIKIGQYYMKRGRYKAAADRFEEATRWNPGAAEAYLLLGGAQEKLRDAKAARAAYEKYLELAPGAKDASGVKKRLAKLPPDKS